MRGVTIHTLVLRTPAMEGWEIDTPGTDAERIAVLFTALAEHTLDPTFEEYGNFVDGFAGGAKFFGNFYDVSGAFRLTVTDRRLAKKLTKAIRANQATPAYVAAKADRAKQLADRLAREAAIAAEQDREHARRYGAVR